MGYLEDLRETMRRDRVWDFMVSTADLELDLSHGTVLYLEDLSVSFDGFKAIDNLNLYIDADYGQETGPSDKLREDLAAAGAYLPLRGPVLDDTLFVYRHRPLTGPSTSSTRTFPVPRGCRNAT